jgi:hypothetical protein
MREHFLVELPAQAVEGGHYGSGVGVFCFQIGGDFGVLLVTQPTVVVDEDGAMQRRFSVLFAGNGGKKRLALTHMLPSVERTERGGTFAPPPAYN